MATANTDSETATQQTKAIITRYLWTTLRCSEVEDAFAIHCLLCYLRSL